MRDRIVWLVTACYAALFTFLGVVKFAGHRNFVDFGIFAQTASSAFGCFCNTIEGSHWAFHASPILYLAGAVVSVWHSPIALVALQAIACALTIPPIAALVAARTDARTARLAALVVALYPALAGLTFNDFHENGFAPAAIAWMLWAFDSGYLRVTLLFAAIALSVKEDQAIFLAIAGALGWWRFRGTSHGRVALIIGIAGFAVAQQFFVHIQPHAMANAHWAPTRFYEWSAEDVRALVPMGLLARLGFFALVFVPLLFLPFRSRMMWLAAAPLAEVLFSRMPTTYTLGSHYAGAWLGYVLVAFAFAVRRLEWSRARPMLVWCAALCVVELLVANPLHPGLNLHPPQARDRALDRFLATLPPRISISTQEEAYTHLALDNPNATLLPDDPNVPITTPFVLIDRDYPESPRLQEYARALVGPCLREERRAENIVLYRVVCGTE